MLARKNPSDTELLGADESDQDKERLGSHWAIANFGGSPPKGRCAPGTFAYTEYSMVRKYVLTTLTCLAHFPFLQSGRGVPAMFSYWFWKPVPKRGPSITNVERPLIIRFPNIVSSFILTLNFWGFKYFFLKLYIDSLLLFLKQIFMISKIQKQPIYYFYNPKK